MPIRPWIHSEEREILKTRVFSVHQHTGTKPDDPDVSAPFVVIDCPDWVNVIALTAALEVVLVEQYRHGTRQVTLEIPGGMVDPGENLVQGALRELREETGYGAPDVTELIGVVAPNPTLQRNRCGTVLARGVRRVGAQTPDPHEELAVRLVPLAEIDTLIRCGRIEHALVIAAFMHLKLLG